MKLLVGFLTVIMSFSLHSQCIEGDCVDGYGTFKCSCGYVYEGEFKDGQKVFGTLTKEDLVYTGQFKDDVAEGQGLIKFIDSTWYEGSFVNNFPEGYGNFHFADGTTYTGEMFEGEFKGLGVMKYPTKPSKLTSYKVGEFENDNLHGFGLSIDSSEWYFGQFENGTPQGFGVFLLDSNVVSSGKVKKGKVTQSVEYLDGSEHYFFGTKNFKLGKETFKVEGKKDASYFYMQVEAEDGKQLKLAFDAFKSQLFISTYKSFPKGRIIDLEGNIFEAFMNQEKGEIEIIETK